MVSDMMKKLFEMLGISVETAANLPDFITSIFDDISLDVNQYNVPQAIRQFVPKLLNGRTGGIVCDPWAGVGTFLATVLEVTQSHKVYAITSNNDLAKIGNFFLDEVVWDVGEPCSILNTLRENLDIVVSIPPFGLRASKPVRLTIHDGIEYEYQGELGHQIIAASSLKLSPGGIGLFVIPQSFFSSQQSVLRIFDKLGLGIKASFALPSGTFSPYTNVPTYLIIIEKKLSSRMFIAQLSNDEKTNDLIIENFNQGKKGASLDLGCFVDITTFSGMDALYISERLLSTERRFGFPTLRLENIVNDIIIGKHGDSFVFPEKENVIFVPLIGNSDVIISMDEAQLKHQNYAQLTINAELSDARFVASFLNSELGREIREINKAGFIPKLSKKSIKNIVLLIPDLRTQKEILKTEALITAEQNTILGLQNEISELRRDLWANPKSHIDITARLGTLSSRLSGDLKSQTVDRFDQWIEILPFPMASILRAWQATNSDDYKTKYEHLLHFFEASTEFMGIILLSALHSKEQFYNESINELYTIFKKHNLSLKRATFGTWKLIIEYLGKKVRQLLSGDQDERMICSDMFADPTIQLPVMLCCKELASIVSSANKMRNDWSGHGGVVGKDEAYFRNERLLSEVQKLREVTGAIWTNIQLVHSLHCRPRHGSFENEVSILMGSNSEFLKETRVLKTWLDVDHLYLIHKDGNQALQLLPLIQVGPSPESAKNACYFFSRVEKDEIRYVSYHYIDQPERKCSIKDVQEVISLLEENGEIL